MPSLPLGSKEHRVEINTLGAGLAHREGLWGGGRPEVVLTEGLVAAPTGDRPRHRSLRSKPLRLEPRKSPSL